MTNCSALVHCLAIQVSDEYFQVTASSEPRENKHMSNQWNDVSSGAAQSLSIFHFSLSRIVLTLTLTVKEVTLMSHKWHSGNKMPVALLPLSGRCQHFKRIAKFIASIFTPRAARGPLLLAFSFILRNIEAGVGRIAFKVLYFEPTFYCNDLKTFVKAL